MAKANIRHKCIMEAREAARRDSNARVSGKSIFIKRHNGKYWIIGVDVTKEQRKCRDIFADAQKLASYELKRWNKKRHWAREAKRHKIRGAHRMAVSYFYRLLKDNGLALEEALKLCREKRYVDTERGFAILGGFAEWEKRAEDTSPFYYRKFGDIEEYYGEVIRLAG